MLTYTSAQRWKSQAPMTTLQTNRKSQALNHKRGFVWDLDFLDLGFIWNLEIGI